MAQTRTEYDECNYRLKLKQSEAPAKYQLYRGQVENCKSCMTNNGTWNNRPRLSGEISGAEKANLVDVESLLTNRTYSLSRCPNDRTLYDKQAHLQKLVSQTSVPQCDPVMDRQYSRLTHPIEQYKELHAVRWEYPLINPVEFVWTWNKPINTSLYIKDTALLKRYPTRINLN